MLFLFDFVRPQIFHDFAFGFSAVIALFNQNYFVRLTLLL